MGGRCGADVTYDEFWLRYLRAHSSVNTRRLHYVGSGCAVVALVLGAFNWRWLIAAPLIGYAFAWTAHEASECLGARSGARLRLAIRTAERERSRTLTSRSLD